MPYWNGNEPIPHWFGDGINLTASVEPGGIQICGEMPEEVWNNWYKALRDNLTQALGYEIGEPEDGFRFKYWTPFVKEYSDIKSIDKKAIVFNDFLHSFLMKSDVEAEIEKSMLSRHIFLLRQIT